MTERPEDVLRHALRNVLDCPLHEHDCERCDARCRDALAALEALVAERAMLATDLHQFGRHVPPCPRWITSGETVDGEPQPCFCGFAVALAASERRVIAEGS